MTTLLAVVLRNRAVIVTAALALLGVYLWWLLHAPRFLLPALSIVPDFGTFASDITPSFIDAAGVAQRLSLLALAVGMVTLAAAPSGARACLQRRTRRWFRQGAPLSWGKYRKTLVRAAPGNGDRRVAFAAQLPRKAAGDWLGTCGGGP